ncbi:MAG: alpha/beta hydrolase [Clostridia bacterium]|nr:alpha/beta hydrolase [Clostridia bacterium]
MPWWAYVIIGVLAFLLIGFILAFVIAFNLTFKTKKRKVFDSADAYELPKMAMVTPYVDDLRRWIKLAFDTPHTDVEIRSFDGLTLRGKYYEYQKGAPVEIVIHGYRSEGVRDMSAAIERCFEIGHSLLLVDQRGCGSSDGNVITFGIFERYDCLKWIDFLIEYLGKDVEIILCGVSMGASTALLASGEKLPKNVKYVLADCGYSDNPTIIKKIVKEMHLPVSIFYPIIKASARLFGGFELEQASPLEAVKNAKIPIILIHGAADDFVPCEMSRRVYEACGSPLKRLVEIEGAGHGVAYPTDKEKYVKALEGFICEMKEKDLW